MFWEMTAAVIRKAPFLDFQIYFAAGAAVRAVRLNPPGKMTAI
jgi:hypothetical protein